MFGSDRLERDGVWVYAVINGSILLMCLAVLVLIPASFVKPGLTMVLWQLLAAISGATVFVIDLVNLGIYMHDRRSARGRGAGGAEGAGSPVAGEGCDGAEPAPVILILRCLIGLGLLLLCAKPLLGAPDPMRALPLLPLRAARAGIIYFAVWLAGWALDELELILLRVREDRGHHGR